MAVTLCRFAVSGLWNIARLGCYWSSVAKTMASPAGRWCCFKNDPLTAGHIRKLCNRKPMVQLDQSRPASLAFNIAERTPERVNASYQLFSSGRFGADCAAVRCERNVGEGFVSDCHQPTLWSARADCPASRYGTDS